MLGPPSLIREELETNMISVERIALDIKVEARGLVEALARQRGIAHIAEVQP